MSRRLAAVAALAVVLGCAGCDAVDSGRDAAAAAGDQLKAEATKQLDAQLEQAKQKAKDEALAAAQRRAAELAADAKKALQEQVASGTSAARAAADRTAKAVASALPSAAPAVAVPKVTVPSAAPTLSVHTVTGTFAPAESFDLSGGSVPCATATNVVGQAVRVDAGATTVTGLLTACAWSTPTALGVSPVFSFVVQKVPAAAAYDISIGDRAWKISGATLAASGWVLSLT